MTSAVTPGEVELIRRYRRQLGEFLVLGSGFVIGAVIVSGAATLVLDLL